MKTKAELNDQLSDRESCRQESSELTRANRKLFHHITTIINKFEKAENRQKIIPIYNTRSVWGHLGPEFKLEALTLLPLGIQAM